MVCQFWLKRLR